MPERGFLEKRKSPVSPPGDDARATPVGVLLAAARDRTEAPGLRATALAGVANACLGCPRAVQAAEAAGGVAVAFSFVAGRARKGADLAVRARAAALLARLVTGGGPDGSAARTLRAAPKALPALAACLAHARHERGDAWRDDERDGLLRAVAGALAYEKAPGAVAAFLASGGYDVLVSLLPAPRRDLGAVTARSVSQTPAESVSTQCAGNACKALLAALGNDDAALRTAVAERLAAGDAVERLVCALANFKDMPVRRNCAVCLAKLMAACPATKDRIRDLRGIEMITILGNALVA